MAFLDGKHISPIEGDTVTEGIQDEGLKRIIEVNKDLIGAAAELGPKNNKHNTIIPYILNNVDAVLMVETPTWIGNTVDGKPYFARGQIDIIYIVGDYVIICDYKRREHGYGKNDPMSKHFVDSIPQITAYILSKVKHWGLSKKKVIGLTFSQEKGWLWKPPVLHEIETWMSNEEMWKESTGYEVSMAANINWHGHFEVGTIDDWGNRDDKGNFIL